MRSSDGAGILKGPSQAVYFATTNRGKFIEASKITSAFGIRLKHLRFEKLEIQSNDLTEIASFAAKQAAQSRKLPVLVEDAGFFVHALGGFPGPYSSYVFKTLGNKGILKLLESHTERRAVFQACVAFCSPRKRPMYFTGTVRGHVARRPRGSKGFGFDPIFIPNRGDERTFAEMSSDEKNALSHRALAFRKFSRWLMKR